MDLTAPSPKELWRAPLIHYIASFENPILASYRNVTTSECKFDLMETTSGTETTLWY
jgi:hypothetical protein